MVRRAETYATHTDGVHKLHHKDLFLENVRAMGNGRFKWRCEKVYRKRSNQQNRYYHGVIINSFLQGWEAKNGRPLSLEVANPETGEVCYFPLSEKEQHDRAHEILKSFFNKDKEGRTKSTTENTTTEMEEFHQYCREWIKAWFGITVPLPGEQSELTFKD